MRILLVEDEPSISSLVKRVFERAGHQVRICVNAAEALAPPAPPPEEPFLPDLAIVDYSLPGMDGLTLVGRLREVQPRLAAILCTGMPMNPPRLDPPLHFLQKPYRPSELRELVDRVTGEANGASHG